jgi:hypothetical protein
MNSLPNELDSTLFCFFDHQCTIAPFSQTRIPVLNRCYTVSDAWLASTFARMRNPLPCVGHSVTTIENRDSGLAERSIGALVVLSKKQNSVEFSSFGSEFIAFKQYREYLRRLRYKLRMMAIPVEGFAYIFADNQSGLASTTNPDSTLKKKSQSTAYRFVREAWSGGNG